MADRRTEMKNCRSSKANSSWSEIPDELCALILSKLSPIDILRFKAVCPYWYKAVEYMISPSSSSSSSSMSQPTCLRDAPWLLLPHDQDDDQDKEDIGDDHGGFRCFYSLGNNKVYNLNNFFGHGICLGSFHGWLLYLNKQLEFVLFNPFLYGIQLPLPPLSTFPDILSVTFHQTTYAYHVIDSCTINCNVPAAKPHALFIPTNPDQLIHVLETWDISSVKDLQKKMRAKAVLSSRPTCSNKNNIGVMVMYAFFGQSGSPDKFKYNNLAFCMTTDHKWTKLKGWYIDVINYHNHFYALLHDYSIQV